MSNFAPPISNMVESVKKDRAPCVFSVSKEISTSIEAGGGGAKREGGKE
jgi:hypothetical protein